MARLATLSTLKKPQISQIAQMGGSAVREPDDTDRASMIQ
jgi:hypothetical protein